MASTFSPTLRIELIGDGDQSGIWGQTTNTNLGTLLEQAITGVVDITMTDANYTLSNFNGVSDESRNAVLVVGGTNAAVRDVIAPLVEKLYVVKNSTVGGFAINIRAATGSSVSVPSGATVWVYCDGTNFNAINTESVGNFEVNGNLTVTGNTNAVAATYTGNVAALNISTANVTATGAGAFTGNVSAANFTGAGLTITSINASNISAGTIANARTTAASANGASTIVARDSNGSFAGNVGTFVTVTGAHSGNGAGLTDINASNISSGTIANARTTAATANGASTIVLRDSNGSFAGNVGTFVTGSFSGNVSAANISSTGVVTASGNVSGLNFIGAGATITSINASNISSGTIANARTTASDANGASTIVARDASGNFTANAITTTSISGNGVALTAINASNVTSGTLDNARTTAASANGASTIVARDASGNFTANVVTATTGTFTSISGNGVALTAINASNITSGTIDNARTTAASANGASTIVARDSSGNFTANAITTTSISGNGVALTAINASNISSGTVASARITGSYTGITGVGTLTAGTWNATTIAVANGGTGVNSSTGTGSVVLSASPTFTGAPLAPTAANGTNTTQIATTAFVQASTTALGLGTMSTQNANNVTITGGSITGITDLTVADGGTGRSTLTANNIILGNGASAVNFVAPGTSGNVLTSNGTTWTSTSTQSAGVGQTWQSVTRTAGTTYTNSTGKPICFLMNFGAANGTDENIVLTIGGVSIPFISGISVSGVVFGQNMAIIPTGLTYSYSSTAGVTKNIYELR